MRSFVPLLFVAALEPLCATCCDDAPPAVVRRIGGDNPWATALTIRDSGRPGPTVVVVGGVHGNESAGILAADQVAKWQPERGRLIVLARANREAIARGKRLGPGTEHRDLNRNFPSAAEPTPRGELAAAIWKELVELEPDWLVDLHEGVDYRAGNSRSVGNSVIVHPSEHGERVAKRLITAVNLGIQDEERRFKLLRYPKHGTLARAAAEHLGCGAMILETTRKGATSERVEQHLLLVRRLLEEVESLDAPEPSSSAAGSCR